MISVAERNILAIAFVQDLWAYKRGESEMYPNFENYGLGYMQAECLARQVQIEFENSVKKQLVKKNKSRFPKRAKPEKVMAQDDNSTIKDGVSWPSAIRLDFGHLVCGGLVPHPLSDLDHCGH